jgi:hypothetical protein
MIKAQARGQLQLNTELANFVIRTYIKLSKGHTSLLQEDVQRPGKHKGKKGAHGFHAHNKCELVKGRGSKLETFKIWGLGVAVRVQNWRWQM